MHILLINIYWVVCGQIRICSTHVVGRCRYIHIFVIKAFDYLPSVLPVHPYPNALRSRIHDHWACSSGKGGRVPVFRPSQPVWFDEIQTHSHSDIDLHKHVPICYYMNISASAHNVSVRNANLPTYHPVYVYQ